MLRLRDAATPPGRSLIASFPACLVSAVRTNGRPLAIRKGLNSARFRRRKFRSAEAQRLSSAAPAAGARVALAIRVTDASGVRWSDWLDALSLASSDLNVLSSWQQVENACYVPSGLMGINALEPDLHSVPAD